MSDYQTLKPRKYYNLSYSYIPDNQVQKVVGTYKRVAFDGEESYQDENERTNYLLKKKSGLVVSGTLPLIDVDVQALYEDEYNEVVEYTTDGAAYAFKTRRERVASTYTVEIVSAVPIKFMNQEGDISVTGSGKTYMRTGTNLTGAEALWLDSVFDGDDVLWGFNNYNQVGAGSYSSEDGVEVSIGSITVDPVWNGNKPSAAIGGYYKLIITVQVYIVDNYQQCQSSFVGSTGYVSVKDITAFKLNIKYYVVTTSNDMDFEVHSDAAQYPDYEEYPLRIEGNEFTNSSTTVWESGYNKPWHVWIGNQILNKYQDGKLFINAKVKAAYLIENGLSMNSEMIINDVDNALIARGDKACIFQLKNIEYEYDGTQFIANVILLEDRAEELSIPMAVKSYFVFDFNNVNILSIKTRKVEFQTQDGCSIIAIASSPTIKLFNISNALAYNIQVSGEAVEAVDVSTSVQACYLFNCNTYVSDIQDTSINAYFALIIDNIKARSIRNKVTGFKEYLGYSNKMDAYTYVKVDTAFHELFGYSIVNKASSVNNEKTDVSFEDAYDIQVEAQTASTVKSKVNLFDVVFNITKRTYISTLEPISASLIDSYSFKGNKLSKVDKISPVQLQNRFEASMKASATFKILTDRPINDVYFFNLSIENWIDLSIEDMLEINVT